MLDQEFRGAARTTTVVDDPLTNRAAGGHEVHFWFFLAKKCPGVCCKLEVCCSLQLRRLRFLNAMSLPLWKSLKLLGFTGCCRPYHTRRNDNFGQNRQSIVSVVVYCL